MKVTYRHQFPAMQYGVAEFTLEDDVSVEHVEDVMQAMVQQCERLLPWPGRGALAPHNEPTQAEPRPSQEQRKKLRDLAKRLEEATGQPPNLPGPATAAEALSQITGLEQALQDLDKPASIPAKQRRCSTKHRHPEYLTSAEYEFSSKHFGKPLCRACQEAARRGGGAYGA